MRTTSRCFERASLRAALSGMLCAAVAIVPTAAAQSVPAPARDTSSRAAVVGERNVIARHPVLSLTIVGVGTTLALRPLDEAILHRWREPDVQRSLTLRNTADAFNFIGGPGFVIASATLLGAGYATHRPTMTQVGVRTAEAIVLNGVAVQVLKGAFGRQRPFVNESTPDVFAFGRGYSSAGRSSFPSGHASSSFAFATAATMVLQARKSKATRYVAPLLYTAATLVGGARVYGAHHWPSDIAAGAFVGTLSGWVVTRHDAELTGGGVRWHF